MFKYQITINPLGLMYGSAGAFLSPENLVGRSGAKFPPEAATVAGLMFSVNKTNEKFSPVELRENLFVSGPFWCKNDDKGNFYVPIPRHKIIAKTGVAEWHYQDSQWQIKSKDIDPKEEKLEPDYSWQTIDSWNSPADAIRQNKKADTSPWRFISFLHPKIKSSERCVETEDGLFLENSVQMPADTSLVYLSTYPLPQGWYRFGGENHIVEIECKEIKNQKFLDLINQPIGRSFALITPAVWGSNRLSHRYPQHDTFPKTIQMLTDKPVPYRYRAKGNLGRGRYAVPTGSVYLLNEPLNKPWWKWDEAWFPKEGYSLKKVGCGLCLPVDIQGVA
jgi:CRISPR-associated protein Cmr3